MDTFVFLHEKSPSIKNTKIFPEKIKFMMFSGNIDIRNTNVSIDLDCSNSDAPIDPSLVNKVQFMH
jgi:hypothetical protein